MRRFFWTMRYQVPLWGPKFALALLVAATVFWFAVLQPLQQQAEVLERQRSTERESKLRQLDMSANSPAADRLGKFYRFFAEGDSISDHLARLYAIAESNQLLLRRAEYRMNVQGDQMLSRYQIVFPIRGSYPSIRRFAAHALAEMPMLALSQVQFQRQAIGDAEGEAQITFTLYLAK
jgi:hypothetical protein